MLPLIAAKEAIVIILVAGMALMGGMNINNSYKNITHQQQVQTFSLKGDTYSGIIMLNGKKTNAKIKPKGEGIEISYEKNGNTITVIISRDTTKEISKEDKQQIETIFNQITTVNKKINKKPKTYLEEKAIKGIEKIISVVKKQLKKSVKKTTKKLFT